MKKGIVSKYLVFFLLFILFIANVRALNDISGGNIGDGSGLSGGYSWDTQYVGLKISIVNSSKEVEEVKTALNEYGSGGALFSNNNNPKSFSKTTTFKWVGIDKITHFTTAQLPNSWQSGENNISIYSSLSNNKYSLLKHLLTYMSKDGSGDYILIEPMVKIGAYYGTAFEMLNAFGGDLKNSCNSFCDGYGRAVFGGTRNKPGGGLLYTTLYATSAVSKVNIVMQDTWVGKYAPDVNDVYKERNLCLRSRTCGKGIGIFSYDEIMGDGKLKIIKKNSSGSKITGSVAKFNVYTNSRCTGTVYKTISTKSGSGESDTLTLPYGTYYLKETQAPSGYIASGSCERFVIDSSTTKTVTITNKTPCEKDFDNKKSGGVVSMKDRISLYKTYGYRNLLDKNKTSATAACSAKNCNPTYTQSCLSSSFIDSNLFSKDDISCYNEELLINNVLSGYCLTSFNLENKLGTNDFGEVFAGQLVLNTPDVVSTGILDKKCYLFDGVSLGGTISNNLYDDYVDKITFGSSNLIPIFTGSEGNKLKIVNSGSNWAEFKGNADYKLNEVKVEVGSGKETCTNCKFIGYGILSKLTEEGKIKVDFNVDLDFDLYTFSPSEPDKKIEDYCSYTAIPKIIKKGDLNLEFRTVSVKNAFPGKSGSQRTPGNNWCTSLKDRVLNTRNNSNNSMGEEPLYTIELTPKKIKKIREYNKKTSYDNTLNCDSSGDCTSDFLNDITIFTLSDMTRKKTQWEIDFNTILYGDVNSDGKIEIKDSTYIERYINGDSLGCNEFYEELADLNSDNIINSKDWEMIQKYLAKYTDSESIGRTGQPFIE